MATTDTTIIRHAKKADIRLQIPAYFSAGKELELTVSIKNNTTSEWTGYLSLELQNAGSKQNVDGLFANIFPNQYFTVDAHVSADVHFPISIPYQFTQPLRICARMYEHQKALDSVTTVITIKH